MDLMERLMALGYPFDVAGGIYELFAMKGDLPGLEAMIEAKEMIQEVID